MKVINSRCHAQVAKARYGSPPVEKPPGVAHKEFLNDLVNENEDLKTEIRKIRYQAPMGKVGIYCAIT